MTTRELKHYCPKNTNGNPNFHFMPITAEYQGKRYFITSSPSLLTAEDVALDFVASFPDARFFVGNKWDSASIDGNAATFRNTYK